MRGRINFPIPNDEVLNFSIYGITLFCEKEGIIWFCWKRFFNLLTMGNHSGIEAERGHFDVCLGIREKFSFLHCLFAFLMVILCMVYFVPSIWEQLTEPCGGELCLVVRGYSLHAEWMNQEMQYYIISIPPCGKDYFLTMILIAK